MTAKVYIHEFVDITGHNRARYMQHITANWSPIGQRSATSCATASGARWVRPRRGPR